MYVTVEWELDGKNQVNSYEAMRLSHLGLFKTDGFFQIFWIMRILMQRKKLLSF